MKERLAKRFAELEEQMQAVTATLKTSHNNTFGRSDRVDYHVLLAWRIKVKNLIVKTCGEESEHYREFTKAEKGKSVSGNLFEFKALQAIFLATKEDFEGGYLSSYRAMVQAEVFDTELEQAQELFNNGYHVAAAVIAGVVLETALRELCDREKISHGKIDKMNADLAKIGVYSKNVQKQITAQAGIRNSAAHGNLSEFSKNDVEQMIPAIAKFLETHLDS